MTKTSKQSTRLELLESVRDALAASLNRQQQEQLTQLSPAVIDYYAGLTTARDAKVSG